MLCVIGRPSTASRNYLVKWRLFLSSPFLSSPSRLRILEQRGECVHFDELPSMLGNAQALASSLLKIKKVFLRLVMGMSEKCFYVIFSSTSMDCLDTRFPWVSIVLQH
ncbi:hypothetical protein H5410_031033 [Solanum commersonii]|uniref:Uncharacterized protein n=1 Tax=Solanum commersonii TaxID=4109 RepID=A0A9J5YIP4_SOLCO|nr:hypothetical protein H5410_031033 [Solanum commersonii]